MISIIRSVASIGCEGIKVDVQGRTWIFTVYSSGTQSGKKSVFSAPDELERWYWLEALQKVKK